MLCKNNKDVMKIVRDRNISFIQIWFTDVLGVMKSFAIRPSELEEAMTEGMGFDGSSIEGFARIEESDMIKVPDCPDKAKWEKEGAKVIYGQLCLYNIVQRSLTKKSEYICVPLK